MVFVRVSNIKICFEVYGVLFYEGKHEINNQFVLMILNIEYSFLYNKNNNSKHGPIMEF